MHAYQIKSLSLLLQKSELVVEYATSGNLASARSMLDEIRFLRAVFIQELNVKEDSSLVCIDEDNSSKKLLRQVAKLNTNLEIIFRWLESTRLSFDTETLVKTREGIGVYLDTQIPAIWNWLEDLIILPEDPEGAFSNALTARGQNKIIILSSGQDRDNIRHISTPDQASAAIADWSDEPIGRQIFVKTSPNSHMDEVLQKELKEIFVAFAVRRNTKQGFSKRWGLQQIENLENVVSAKNMDDLKPVIDGRKCVIVSPGPSLKKNITLLANSEHEHLVIAVAQACPALKIHGIYPDFVVVIDPIDYSHVLEGIDCSKIPGLIISDICHSAFYEKPFQNIFTFYPYNPAFNTGEITGAKQTAIFGGSVTVTATYLAAHLGASEISLIGSDLSFEEELYYPYDAKGFDVNSPAFAKTMKVPGYFGGEVSTSTGYLVFKRELEEIAAAWEDRLILNNCTEGGVYLEGFAHIPLVETLSRKTSIQKSVHLLRITDDELAERLKKLGQVLHLERIRLNKAKSTAQECLHLAEKLNDPHDKKLPTLNKKEKKLALLVSDSESLDIFCNTEIAAIQRQINRINSFDGNISLSKSMYKMIIEAIEVLRATLSKQISALKQKS